MHEFSMVSSLADAILRHIPQGGRLVSAQVAVGALEHLDGDLMQTAWEALMAEPPWTGPLRLVDTPPPPVPVLELSTEPVRVRCRECGHQYWPPEPANMVCPECAHARPLVLAGTGITLLSLSIEQTRPAESRSIQPQDVS